ncbi:Bax inhibitor-1/YccA family protein [Halosquirtibacter xylanolyticus]|uniref:Bax inhibitor-1/YccA family protein n=1 Tax=Halosquirtibacter xylanolyticus TaxID=3374599 RepID=UPI003749012C|nr:Bax inhibitor-1/YccA family protein [Prolixibacteraceae bacterium]
MENRWMQRDASEVQSAFMQKVYAWMFSALLITAGVAYYSASSATIINMVFSSGYGIFPFIIAEFALVYYISSRIDRISSQTAKLLFFLYSALNGVTMGIIFLAYTSASIYYTFLITAVMFGIMSVYGMVTKKDLSSIGNIAFMALIGIIIASVVNIFLNSEALYWIISYAGVILFTGLTAYDTQKIKKMHSVMAHDEESGNKVAILGALTLYLDFINLFLFLLRFFGRRN